MGNRLRLHGARTRLEGKAIVKTWTRRHQPAAASIKWRQPPSSGGPLPGLPWSTRTRARAGGQAKEDATADASYLGRILRGTERDLQLPSTGAARRRGRDHHKMTHGVNWRRAVREGAAAVKLRRRTVLAEIWTAHPPPVFQERHAVGAQRPHESARVVNCLEEPGEGGEWRGRHE